MPNPVQLILSWMNRSSRSAPRAKNKFTNSTSACSDGGDVIWWKIFRKRVNLKYWWCFSSWMVDPKVGAIVFYCFSSLLYCFCVFLLLWAVNSPIFGCCLCIFFWDCVRSVLKGVRRDFCLVFCFWVAVLTLWGLQLKKYFPLFDLNLQTGLGRTGNDPRFFFLF